MNCDLRQHTVDSECNHNDSRECFTEQGSLCARLMIRYLILEISLKRMFDYMGIWKIRISIGYAVFKGLFRSMYEKHTL